MLKNITVLIWKFYFHSGQFIWGKVSPKLSIPKSIFATYFDRVRLCFDHFHKRSQVIIPMANLPTYKKRIARCHASFWEPITRLQNRTIDRSFTMFLPMFNTFLLNLLDEKIFSAQVKFPEAGLSLALVCLPRNNFWSRLDGENKSAGRDEIKFGAKICRQSTPKYYRSGSRRVLSATHVPWLETCPTMPGYSDHWKKNISAERDPASSKARSRQ